MACHVKQHWHPRETLKLCGAIGGNQQTLCCQLLCYENKTSITRTNVSGSSYSLGVLCAFCHRLSFLSSWPCGCPHTYSLYWRRHHCRAALGSGWKGKRQDEIVAFKIDRHKPDGFLVSHPAKEGISMIVGTLPSEYGLFWSCWTSTDRLFMPLLSLSGRLGLFGVSGLPG